MMPNECGTCTIARLHELLEYAPKTGLFRWRNPTSRQAPGWFKGSKSVRDYRRLYIDGRNYLAHVVAWAMHYGAWPDHEVDHEDRVQWHNHISNLRSATHAQNCVNRSRNRNNTSGFAGVSKARNGFRATIGHGGTRQHLGVYDTAEDAADARAAYLRKQVYGDFVNAE